MLKEMTLEKLSLNNQVGNYIVLKPIAERFNRVSSEITDDEIKNLIKAELRDQLKCVDFGGMVAEIVSDWIEDNTDTLKKLLLEAYKSKLA